MVRSSNEPRRISPVTGRRSRSFWRFTMIRSSLILKNETDSPAYVNALSKNFSEKSNPLARAARSGPNPFPLAPPGQTAIGTKALGLLFLRRKVAKEFPAGIFQLDFAQSCCRGNRVLRAVPHVRASPREGRSGSWSSEA